MKTLVEDRDHASVLSEWRGGKAHIWAFHVSFKRVAISLSRGGQEALYIVAMGCEHITGPFRWDRANIEVITGPPNQWGEVRRRIVDKGAGFELICSDVAIARGPGEVPIDPFDGFFDAAK